MQLVINRLADFKKHQTLESLTKVEFLRNLKDITFFEIFEIHQLLVLKLLYAFYFI